MSIDLRSHTDKSYGIQIHHNGYSFYQVDEDIGYEEFPWLDSVRAIEPMHVPFEVRDELEYYVPQFCPDFETP